MNKSQLEKEIPVLALAFVGDSVYDTYIRSMLLRSGKYKPNLLHKRAEKFNKATSQSIAFLRIQNELEEIELNIALRGRNVKGNSFPKSATVAEYKNATGLEAVMGYLYLNNNFGRIETLMSRIVEIIQGEED
ncbi:Mini-ribonuclease 3 [Alkalicella caledoniensis]|uniref:Mini-ribonuclease 3 n=1 Tax=Alkalicella caledoniensis TaxID=2731377 RepID=A0A7G9W7Z9_ALKCA|nr:ribonuclease III domain-containing protein [Alkalicella caledoniensis]QNO14811.1 Mini-ribonuclease 3 [Alkalicella caledoniensis]